MKKLLVLLATVGIVVSGVVAHAQLAPPNATGVSMGHVHLTVKDVDATEKFFVTLGGTVLEKTGENHVIRFPGALLLVRTGEPTAGSVGSIVNHFSFNVKNSKETLARWSAAGLHTETGAKDGKTLSDEFVRAQLAAGRNAGQFFVYSPDGLTRVEILENVDQQAPIVFHHIHFYLTAGDIPAIKAWYAKTFGAIPGMRGQNQAADLPGVNLSFSPSDTPTVATKGRMIDHIGFEVAGLEGFCRSLEANGVTFEAPYKKRPDGVGTAFIVDPWGARIELTDGLRRM